MKFSRMISKTVIMQHHNNAVVKILIINIAKFKNVIILKVNATITSHVGKWLGFEMKFLFYKF